MGRPSRHEYFMTIAEVVSHRATCDRAHVGCVLVIADRIVTTGYNGSPPNLSHCDDVDHDMEEGHCVRTIHAEMNAVLQAAKHGVALKGATCYCTTRPCFQCTYALYSVGITQIIYRDEYSSMSSADQVRIEKVKSQGVTIISCNSMRGYP